MRDFRYSRPETVSDVLDELAAAPGGARALAGGMTLLPTLKQRLATVDTLVDLSGIPLLTDIETDDGALQIGAMATHAAIAASPLVRELSPALCGLAKGIGDAQVRNRGTIGGSIANNDPAADWPAAALALRAVMITDRRMIDADSFFVGMFETALEEDELILAVQFPGATPAAYAKFRHPISGYAMAGVCIARHADEIRVAVTGAGPCVFRSREIEEALESEFSVASANAVRLDPASLNSDIHASGAYRAQLVSVMAAQAVRSLVEGEHGQAA
jgi:carbon-monoxide dehydrogenase medium subunit